MKSYKIVAPTDAERTALLEAFPRMTELSAELRDKAQVAWASMVASSSFAEIGAVPFSHGSKARLIDHTNDVIEAGLALHALAESRWGWEVDRERLLAILLLHDLDKPLLMRRENGLDIDTPVSSRIPHGVLAGLMLAELGVGEEIIAAVATHATHAPLRGPDPEVLILHYADLFSADAEIQLTDRMPFFRRCR
ncbi:HD domain-containing protein [Salipiger abyssi]|uniref:HD domain-containing protein n=1 Tax=Salipiger abyssi TaxID=1250539 RepID=UPI001A8D6376|nr:HD domain-containing protein [Salipiger abyssi]MBN9888946.1 HD domain-containing protein [Salipiger abyssi]